MQSFGPKRNAGSLLLPGVIVNVTACVAIWTFVLWTPATGAAGQHFSLTDLITPRDALLVTAADGQDLFKENAEQKCVPASTLKILTALSAFHYLGPSFRFRTDSYLTPHGHLKIKAFGDPLLISEVWHDIADMLAERITSFGDLILDTSFFAPGIQIPGVESTTHPYDAVNGALGANFNTVYFKSDRRGRLVSAEPQTPLVPYARRKIRALHLSSGRYMLFRNGDEAARYAGELLLNLLQKHGVKFTGRIRAKTVDPRDRLILRYRSRFNLQEVVGMLMASSNNFIANQILLASGANLFGPPATLGKGVQAVADYCRLTLGLPDIQVVEGSGISRLNRLSAREMTTILKAFEPYRNLLKKDGPLLYKSGTLRGIRTRVGYIERESGRPLYFVVFLNRSNSDIYLAMDLLKTFQEQIGSLPFLVQAN
jgi:D-alanyl-D-alanine carboxypeptidase/D-alanyl-D-alanine-endopeptidase (penicillin-binding protein 4)